MNIVKIQICSNKTVDLSGHLPDQLTVPVSGDWSLVRLVGWTDGHTIYQSRVGIVGKGRESDENKSWAFYRANFW